jgi:hypothetical protein
MKNITRAKEQALGLIMKAALTLFFCICRSAPIFAAGEDLLQPVPGYDDTLAGYMTRMLLALALLGGVGYAAAKFLPKRFMSASHGSLRVMGTIALGRDMVYILRTGPEVIALFVGKNAPMLLGRWRLDEWEDYEASSCEAKRGGADTQGNAD